MAVKSILLYIGLHLARDEIPHRLTPFDQLADLCRRDIQNGDLFKAEGVARGMDPTLDLLVVAENRDQGLWEWRVGIPARPAPVPTEGGAGGDSYRGEQGLLKSGAGHHDEVAKGEKVLKFFPGLNLHKCIPPQDEEEGLLIPLAQIPNRID